MGWASIGTDTGGSIRIPASACGVVGLKPTFGEITTVGVVPLSVSLDHVGPLAASVGDAWAIYEALIGSSHQPGSAGPIDGVRLGRLGGYFLETLDDDVRARYEEALSRLKDANAKIMDLELRRLPDIAATYINVALPEAFAYHSNALERAPEEFCRNVRERLEMGGRISRDAYVQRKATERT
jgi:aspartyl-tRNA(Asn)/glutamyl-tRNA(Gln) amidotransferase subunit A